MCVVWYNQGVTLGLTLAFDEWIFTGYLQVERTRYVHKTIATFIAKAKSYVAETVSGIASAVRLPVLATARI